MSCSIYRGSNPVQKIVWQSADEASTELLSPTIRGAGCAPHGEPDEELRTRLLRLEQESEARVREALAKGVAEGRKMAEADLAAELQRIARSIEDLSGMKARLRKEAESDLVRLAVAIARRVLRRELTVDAEALRGIVSAALERMQMRDICQVRVHPAHEQLIRHMMAAAGAVKAEIVADNSLLPGGITFETNRGSLDASIDSQLLEIERGLTDLLGR
jgi:flagellar assembly protein FliH